jgi:hypothetical protein
MNNDNRSAVIIAMGMAAVSGALVGLALALIFGSATPKVFGVSTEAHAQQSPQPPMPTLSQLLKLRESIPGKKPLTKAAPLLNGWNFRVCTESFAYSNGTTSSVFVTNTDGSGLAIGSISVLTPGVQTTIQADLIAACQHAPKGYWVHITDATRVSFDAILIDYP